MIANPNKFHFFLSRSKENIINIEVKIGDKIIKSQQDIELLGVKIDNHLKFESHVKKLCKSAFKYILPYEVKYFLIQSFIYANFNYCPLIWNFSSSKSLLKINHIQKSALRLLYDDDLSSYEELLQKSNRSSINIYRLRTLCTEINKTLNSLNSLYMKEIFQFQENRKSVRQWNINNLTIKTFRTSTFGTNSWKISTVFSESSTSMLTTNIFMVNTFCF